MNFKGTLPTLILEALVHAGATYRGHTGAPRPAGMEEIGRGLLNSAA